MALRSALFIFLAAFLIPASTEARGESIRVSDGVYCVGRGNWGRLKALSAPQDSNVYLISGGDELALVDTGTGVGIEQILSNLRARGFDPNQLKKIFLTSAHFDHSGGVIPLLEQFPNLEIYAGEPEVAPLRDSDAGYLAYSLLSSMPTLEPIRVSHTPSDGEVIRVGRVSVTALRVPGHTPGATAYLVEVAGQRILFTGDTAIGDQPLGKGILGPLDGHWRSNVTDLDNSLRRLFHLNAEIMLPGHGRWFKGRRQVQENLQHCQWRLDFLLRIPDVETLLMIGEAPDPR